MGFSKGKLTFIFVSLLMLMILVGYQNCGRSTQFSQALNANGTYTSGGHNGLPLEIENKMITDLQAQDLDGDGHPDMVVTFGANSMDPNVGHATAICWDFQNGWDDTNQKFTGCTQLGNDIQTSNAVIADMNHDGAPDVVQFNYGNSYVYLNDGQGNFSAQTIYQSQCDATTGIVGDFNNDNFMDIAFVTTQMNNHCGSGSPVSRDLVVEYGSDHGFLPVTYALPNNGVVNQFVVGLDHGHVSNATYDDIIIGNFREGGFYILKSDGHGGFQSQVQTIANLTASPHDSYNFTLADADGDGKLDILIANYLHNDSSYQSKIYYGNGNGTFQAGVSLSNSTGILNFAVKDVDGDGIPDLVAARYNGGSIYWGQGSRHFSMMSLYTLPSGTYIKSPMHLWNANDNPATEKDLSLVMGFYDGQTMMLTPVKPGSPVNQ